MFALLRRCWRAMRKPDALEPVRPIVAPDPERTAGLERLRKDIKFKPSQGFIHERFHERRN